MEAAIRTLVLEIVRTGLPLVAIAISLSSLWLTRRLWYESNRPIVVAYVRTHSNGNLMRAYDIVVANAGSRPAANVRLKVDNSALEAALEKGVIQSEQHKPILAAVRRCFSVDANIPVLLNGENRSNSFGFTGNAAGGGSLWQHNASIPITITYSDFSRRSFETELSLRIWDTDAFAGGAW